MSHRDGFELADRITRGDNLTPIKKSNDIANALGAKKTDLLRFQAELRANPELRAKFLQSPDATMRSAGFQVSEATAALLTSGVKEALDRHGNPSPSAIDVNITTRISFAGKEIVGTGQ
jgi:hypothetical protein